LGHSNNILVLKNFAQPRDAGIHYRLMCLTGDKKGEIYFLKGERVIMGRSEESDVVVHDIKSSRFHAELKKVGDQFYITDLGSQNGLLVNEAKITQHKLSDSDRIIIGQTVYKFNIVEVKDRNLDLLNSINNTINEANNPNQQNSTSTSTSKLELASNQSKDDAENDEENLASANNPKSFKNIIVLLIFAAGAYTFFFDDTSIDASNKEKKIIKDNPSNLTQDFTQISKAKAGQDDKDLEEKLKVIFQRGLRESREGNYFRAISEFNLALILSPQNARASYYLNRTTQVLDNEIKTLFIEGRRSFDSLKYTKAINSYCTIVRLLQNFPTDERLKTAQENIIETELRLGLNEGDTKCF
jgi:hypothetical protein